MLLLLLAALLAANTHLTTACEGYCITGITRAFVRNYYIPVHRVFLNLETQIIEEFSLDGHSIAYIQPINETFYDDVYEFTRQAIFPSYFHGKCQDPRTGINPPGCPNPNCPVVCGTPGSLVHFYPTLRSIVFRALVDLFQKIAEPSSEAFSKTSSRLHHAIQSRRSLEPVLRFPLADNSGSWKASGSMISEHRLNGTLSNILNNFGPLLEKECGGFGHNGTLNLPRCSWESAMKAYILTFP